MFSGIVRKLSTKSLFQLSPEVQIGLSRKAPVVALESTIITHGMPYPQNLQTALEIEEIVRNNGCIPATIALMDGVVKIGLTNNELEKLAKTGYSAQKTSRRDIARVLFQKQIGATTVSGTMIAAHKVGIDIFVTGGIGGFHRGDDFDISADLTELGRTPVAVVCSGVKSFLDIPKTLEYLETQGVAVCSFGSNQFPEFYVNSNKYKSNFALESVDDAAKLIHTGKKVNLNSGVVIAVPIPTEHSYPDPAGLYKAIDDALIDARSQNITGKDITPFLLDKINTLTGGKSLAANIALVKNNAKIGSQIAFRLSQLRQSESNSSIIIGGTVLDVTSKLGISVEDSELSTSIPGSVVQSAGGVGRNVAEACFRAGGSPKLVSVVGNDFAGQYLRDSLEIVGMDTTGLQVIQDQRTAVYSATYRDNGELVVAVADMEINEHIDFKFINDCIKPNLTIIGMDANLPLKVIERTISKAQTLNIPILFEPTSVTKCSKIFDIDANLLKSVQFVTPDIYEAKELADKVEQLKFPLKYQPIHQEFFVDGLEEEYKNMNVLLNVFPNVVLKCGSLGCLVGTAREHNVQISYLKANKINVQSVNGAGDTMTGVLMAALSNNAVVEHDKLVEIIQCGMRASELSLQSRLAVSPAINASLMLK